MDEIYCALCGVSFGIHTDLYHGRLTDDDVLWTDFFLALRRKPALCNDNEAANPDASFYLSGVGEGIAYDGRVQPQGYDIRDHENYDDFAPPGDAVVAYTNRGTDKEIVYPMHPHCWDLFLQSHALLARGNQERPDLDALGALFAAQDLEEDDRRGLKPDWMPNFAYGDVEQFWADGWLYSEELEASEVYGITDGAPGLDYLVQDPTKLPDFNQLLNDPPILGQNVEDKCVRESSGGSADPLSRLPAELRLNILCYLSTSSVQCLRLASRSMAAVKFSPAYWRSRFEWPNELCYIQLPSNLRTGHPGNEGIDWKTLCTRLVHPQTTGPGLRNRNRILSLTSKLAKRLLSPRSSFDARAEEPPVGPSLVCGQYVSCFPQTVFRSSSVKFAKQSAITSIAMTFKYRGQEALLVGIAFTSGEDSLILGGSNGEVTLRSELANGEFLIGMIVGLTPNGVVGIDFLTNFASTNNRLPGHGIEDLGILFAMGKLISGDRRNISGMKAGFAKDGRIVQLALLESMNNSVENTDWPSTAPNGLWYPSIPSDEVIQVSPVGLAEKNVFSYMQHMCFVKSIEALQHLTGVSVNLAPEDAGVYDFHVYFDDRDPIPNDFRPRGKEVNFLIDGPAGERIYAIDIVSSNSTDSIGINFVTNMMNKSAFVTMDLSEDPQVKRLLPRPDSHISGIFGRVDIKEGMRSCFQTFGFLCTEHAEASLPDELPSRKYAPKYDDHFNLWTTWNTPSTRHLVGEPCGRQPNHGFISWVDLDRPITCVTAGLSVTKRDVFGKPTERGLTGLKIDFEDSEPLLLGRYETLGSLLQFHPKDKIVRLKSDLKSTSKFNTLNEMIFITENGVMKGFKDGLSVDLIGESPGLQSLHLSGQLQPSGLAWSFDLTGNVGLQPVYQKHCVKEPETPAPPPDVLGCLYPSMSWNRRPPPDVQVRPIPTRREDQFGFNPTILSTDILKRLPDSNLVAIEVHYNAYLQGITLEYKTGEVRTVGNAVGQAETFFLDEEHIFAVWIHERVSILNIMSLPREVCWTDGIKFGVVKWVNGSPQVRWSPFYGCAKPFGPFLHRQRGLWDANGGGSASPDCFKPQTRKLGLKRGTFFAGLYVENLNTFVRRAGILVADYLAADYPILPLNVEPPRPSLSTKELESHSSSEPPSQELVPWLGPSPPGNHRLSSTIGKERGTYRLWCLAPADVSSITIYQHTTSSRKIITIGLEFHIRHDPDSASLGKEGPASVLLGHRTLFMEHSTKIDLEPGEKIIGFSLTEGDPSLQLPPNAPLAILSKIEIIKSPATSTEASTANPQPPSRGDTRQIAQGDQEEERIKPRNGIKTSTVVTEGPKKTAVTKSTVIAEPPTRILGFYAYVEEHIEGIGLILGEDS